MSPQELLSTRFGIQAFKPGQQAVIEHLLAGRSAAAVFPTGGGKSLCYQLPALLLPGLTLVVSPLIALMKDQIDALERRGISAARIDSTLAAGETGAIMQRIRSGETKLLYVAPERFNNERFRESIERLHVSLFAVDEAHCISEWGHNFRPDYLKLVRFAERCRAERLLALTATATPDVLRDICREFKIEAAAAIRTGFFRPNLSLQATSVSARERDQRLVDQLRARPGGAAIVYVTLQKTAEQVAERLTAAGFSAKAYHAGMEPDERNSVQNWFRDSHEPIVVATIAFGMGIDKADIRYVYHYNLPKSLENYSQEIGRSGRDGLPATCDMLLCPDDLQVLENFALGDTPSAEAVQSLVKFIFRQPEHFDVSLYDLSSKHDIKQLVVRTLLVYLELGQWIEEGTAFYDSYSFQPRCTSAEMLQRFEGERRDFLASVLRQAQKAKTWFKLDLTRTSEATGAPRERIIRALDYLAEQQLLTLKAEGVRNRFTLLRKPDDVAALAAELHDKLVARETRELERLQQVLSLVSQPSCFTAQLCEHFGETLSEPCGSCTYCLTGTPVKIDTPAAQAIPDRLWQQAAAVRHKYELCSPRDFARFLCGLTSPGLTRSRASRDSLFGSLTHVPYRQVYNRAQESPT
ncbi:ATP-dependent DNA helicase RecQ [Anatilimnocola sp. NA78]|uniref:RecQ family ATP-dependent DNA helicase n=1 Tax=Anatilimnocola sp. NA78 TaxID=3415683 RepID=UPI003CE4CEB9